MMERAWCACVVLVVAWCGAAAAAGALSSLYVDNGLDQTVIQRRMSSRERQVVELEILELLGIGERPRRARAAPLERSAPSFLLDVYRELADERDAARPTRSSRLALSGDEQAAIADSDIIMTFQSKRHQMESLRHEHGRHVWFDVSDVPARQGLVGAELRLYQAPPGRNLSAAPGPAPALYTVDVKIVVDVDNFGGLVLEDVGSVNTSAASDGWLEVNVTSALAGWVTQPHTNKGFFITLHPHEAPELDMKPEEIGIVNVKGTEGKRPFMVAFFKAAPGAPGGGDPVVATRTKRAANKRKRLSDYGYSDNYSRNPLTDASHWTTRSCQIQTLYVSFKDLDWQDWIIAPDGYGAFYCSGECNFPLNAHMNATNHAIVQTLVHLLNPNKVPKPCCAPTKLTPLAVLYFADDSNVILRKYKNMVVKSCGCH